GLGGEGGRRWASVEPGRRVAGLADRCCLPFPRSRRVRRWPLREAGRMDRSRIRRLTATAALLAALLPPAQASAAAVSVSLDRTSISTSIGKSFTLHSTIANDSARPASGLVAHLNVLSLRPGVYVDPEDWSSHRTRYLPLIPAGRSLTVSWRVQAVNSGSIGIYVAALRESGASQPPVTGPTLHVSIARRVTLNSGGIIPLALGIPGLIGLLTVGLRARRRRS